MSRRLRLTTMLAGVFVYYTWTASGRAQLVPEPHTLDLTAPNVIKTMPTVNEGGGSAREGQPSPAVLPLKLRIVQLDRDVYELGSSIAYAVELTNVGDQPIRLPWSADLALIKQPGRSFIESYLSLSVSDRPGSEYHLATVILAGSDTVRDSIETIRPGEVALIKVASSINPPPDSHIAGLSVSAQAVYRLSPGPFVEWQDLRSTNTLQIAFRRPR